MNNDTEDDEWFANLSLVTVALPSHVTQPPTFFIVT